ncbi:hypothetical protein F5Y05DRAFT_424579 [Hypoxylon sp. FL0543]|nr:hypothetical protein F5Y05DRAFT_424579 [Hypoxylon sp. FL0543]
MSSSNGKRTLPIREKRVERPEAAGESEAPESSTVDTPTKKTVLTGEYRIPLRERVQAMRQEVQQGRREERQIKDISKDLEALANRIYEKGVSRVRDPTSAPRPPVTPTSSPSPAACPGAPSKPKRQFDLRRLSLSDDEDDDAFFDRFWASRDENTLRKKKSSKRLNERHRRGSTRPETPSPLRSSFNFEEMEKMKTALSAVTARLNWEIDNADPADFRKDGSGAHERPARK